MTAPQQYDLAVIGAGIAGLAMAKTYLQVNPHASVIILDDAPSLGGAWAKGRIYSTLKTNITYGSMQYVDFPMSFTKSEKGEPIQGTAMTEYFQAYADRFDLTRRITSNSKVQLAEIQPDSSWILTIADKSRDGQQWTLYSRRIVVAGGQTSEPVIHRMKGQENFNRPILHMKNLGTQPAEFWKIKNAVVQGSSKSGFDSAYELAEAGMQVHWIIRKSGSGPCYMGTKRVGPLQLIPDALTHTRLVSWISPCIWGENDGYTGVRRFLTESKFGREVPLFVNGKMQQAILSETGIMKHPETAKLKPWYDIFWVGTTKGLLNYENDFYEHVRSGRIKIYIDDVDHLSDGSVHLASGEVIQADAYVSATGWNASPSMRFLREGKDMSEELGLPHATSNPSASYTRLAQNADAEILSSHPALAAQPPPVTYPGSQRRTDTLSEKSSTTVKIPYLLHRSTVPPEHIQTRTIALIGAYRSTSTILLAQIQSLWATAFFANRLPHISSLSESMTLTSPLTPSPASQPESIHDQQLNRIKYETVLHARYQKWRYPLSYGGGEVMPDFFFDNMPLVDLFLKELGLRRWRKTTSSLLHPKTLTTRDGQEKISDNKLLYLLTMWKEWITPYGPADYQSLVDEWIDSQDRVENRKMKSHAEMEDDLWRERGKFLRFLVMGTLITMGILLFFFVSNRSADWGFQA